MKSTKARSASSRQKPRVVSSSGVRPKAAAARTTKKSSTKAAKALPKKVAKTTPKKVVKSTPKALPKKSVKATPKKVATAAPTKAAKTPSGKSPQRTVRKSVRTASPSTAPQPVERTPLTPLVKTASSGVGSSGIAGRGPTDRELRTGDDLPSLSRRPVSRVDVARYCAASGDFNLIALDEPRARDVGLPAVVVPGSLSFALADACVAGWLGRQGRTVRMGARMVKMVWPDDELVARARVSDVRDAASGREVELDVWVENQKGELVLRGQSTCVVPGVFGAAGS